MPGTQWDTFETYAETQYVNRDRQVHATKWKTFAPHSQEWVRRRSECIIFGETRTISEEQNTAIDKTYDEITQLVSLRSSDTTNQELEAKIQSKFQRLRELQKREGDLIRKQFQSGLAGPIASALDILSRMDEIRAIYGNTPYTDSSPERADTTET